MTFELHMTNIYHIAAHREAGFIHSLKGKVWIPVKNFEDHLYQELGFTPLTNKNDGLPAACFEGGILKYTAGVSILATGLIYGEPGADEIFWKQLCWEEPFILRFNSIGEAAHILRSIQRNWAHYPVSCFRRAELITAKLPYISKKERNFPYTVPLADMGIWSLLDEHTLLASAKTSSPFPLGLVRFVEDHENPPSRAYLKLWEALCLLDFYYRQAVECGGFSAETVPQAWALPQSGSRCIDAGACPGGWTWVLHGLGADIVAIDRSPLADTLMNEPRITFMQHDAFTLRPESLGTQDWIFSDVICYPPRLLEWVERWLASGLCKKFVCTIKMQGAPDFETVRRFARIPHSKIVHLTANKHELTWLHAPFLE